VPVIMGIATVESCVLTPLWNLPVGARNARKLRTANHVLVCLLHTLRQAPRGFRRTPGACGSKAASGQVREPFRRDWVPSAIEVRMPQVSSSVAIAEFMSQTGANTNHSDADEAARLSKAPAANHDTIPHDNLAKIA